VTAIVSGLLAGTACYLWHRSYRVADEWWVTRVDPVRAGDKESMSWCDYLLCSDRGHFSFETTADCEHGLVLDVGYVTQHISRVPGSLGLTGTFACRVHLEQDPSGRWRYCPDVELPYSVAAVGCGVLPGAWFGSRIVRRRRRPPHACRRCGYDLRATPDRCPECGAGAVDGGT
jgi:hypothetical protein